MTPGVIKTLQVFRVVFYHSKSPKKLDFRKSPKINFSSFWTFEKSCFFGYLLRLTLFRHRYNTRHAENSLECHGLPNFQKVAFVKCRVFRKLVLQSKIYMRKKSVFSNRKKRHFLESAIFEMTTTPKRTVFCRLFK